jgi:hypothetical protein
MKNCEQMKGMNVFEHGISVHNYFNDLKNHILNNTSLKYEWKLPDWIFDKSLWKLLVNDNTIKNYQIYHDCGKPFCLTIDDEGRKHFKDHAMWSYKIWLHLGMSNEEAELMLNDMAIHLLKSKDVENFSHLNNAATLLITGLSELHSNAAMFGGVNSTSFKIKWKNINKFGKRITHNLTIKQEI